MMKTIAWLIVLLVWGSSALGGTIGGLDAQNVPSVNKLENGGFENGESRWTESGSSVLDTVTSGVNLGVGERSASWDASAATETLTSSQTAVDIGHGNQTCWVSWVYKGGDANITAQVIDGTSAVLGSTVLSVATGYTRQQTIYTCPTSGTVAFRLLAGADAAIVYLDDVFLGIRDVPVNASPIVYEQTDTVTTFGGATGTITHNKSVAVADQVWTAVVTTGSASLQLDPSAFITDKTVDDMDYDFSGLAGSDVVTVKLTNTAHSATSVSTVTYDSGRLTAAPSFPLNHGLPGIPRYFYVLIEGQSTAGTWDMRMDLCSADATQIDCDLSSLTIGGSNAVQIVASMTPGGSAVAEVGQGTSGLVLGAGQLKGTNTNDNASTGYVGEHIIETGSGATCAATTTYVEINSISLPAGDWDVWGSVALASGGSGITRITGVISVDSALATGSSNNGGFTTRNQVSGANVDAQWLPIGPIRVSLASTTSYYLNGSVTYSGTCPSWSALSSIQARRVR